MGMSQTTLLMKVAPAAAIKPSNFMVTQLDFMDVNFYCFHFSLARDVMTDGDHP